MSAVWGLMTLDTLFALDAQRPAAFSGGMYEHIR